MQKFTTIYSSYKKYVVEMYYNSQSNFLKPKTLMKTKHNMSVNALLKYILKAKSNFTLWPTEYIFIVFYLTNLNNAMSCWYPP